MKLLVAGGRQGRSAGPSDRSHRPLYDLAVAAVLDPDRGTLEPWFTWRTPDAPEGVGHRFGAPSVDGGAVVLCTEREVLRVEGGVGVETLPAYNDLHHAAVFGGATYAVATGVDGVIGPFGYVPVVEGARLPEGELRFRELADRAHPNFVFAHGGRLWVTRGALGDVTPLGGGPAIRVADVVVHDGVSRPEGVWLTAVDGRLILIDPEEGRVLRTIALDPGGGEPLGWCRGLWVGPDRAWVGFTRIRATRLRSHLAWIRGRLRGRPIATRRPTRLVEVDLASGRAIRAVDTEPVGLDAVFGLAGMP